VCYAYRIVASPVGDLKLVASEKDWSLSCGQTTIQRASSFSPRQRTPNILCWSRPRGQLNEYFAGERRTFTVALDPQGTAFQKRVWDALLTIPFGEIRSYAQIAQQIGEPTAYRAVGAANGRNPLSIIAPCHRVIGTNGALTGFAGGLATKQKLLALEGSATAA
jgi:methylated-DNA-[protein]-cysteine S-methyltransferase